MKMLITSALFLSVSAFASDCFNSVKDEFINRTANYEYHHVSEKFTAHAAKTTSFISYGVEVKLGYDFPVVSYSASNEMWGGFGAYEIVVEPNACTILKMKEVYSE